jgi:uncharacterized protein YifN (PemK superfamily)|nr:type II toxin-antitoxin system PemK/MazF family toxin [Herbaspirillum sp. ASV7]
MLNYDPVVGEILQCHFGKAYVRRSDGRIEMQSRSMETRLPPEMVKNRLVVVLNNRIGGGCIVVPLSKTRDPDRLSRRWHVEIVEELIAPCGHFTRTVRFATAEQVQVASKFRLARLAAGPKQHLPRDLVAEIQCAVMRAIGGGALLVRDKMRKDHREQHGDD